MQHLDIASVTGDQYAVLQFKGLYAGMQDTVWWRGQSGAGLRGQTCLVVTVPVVSRHWSGHTSRSVYNIHVGVGGPGGDSESPYGYNLCVASYFYANFEYLGAHLAKWLNIVSNVKVLVGEGAFSMIVKSSQRFV